MSAGKRSASDPSKAQRGLRMPWCVAVLAIACSTVLLSASTAAAESYDVVVSLSSTETVSISTEAVGIYVSYPDVRGAVGNQAKECKAAKAADSTAFAQRYGEAKNAFGKCVSLNAKSSDVVELPPRDEVPSY